MKSWKLQINDFLGGFAPSYWKETYPSFGNANMAADMTSIDLTSPSVLKQGPGLSTVSGTVTQLMRGIMDNVVSANQSYGFGGTTVYSVASAAVTTARVIASTTGHDVVLYDGHLKYIYGTDIGDFDLSSTWDDDWGTVSASITLTAGLPHQGIVAGTTGLLSILNGSVVSTWDGTTGTDDAFNTRDTDITLVSQVWNLNRFWFAGNKPNTVGRNEASIFVWDGNATSWEQRIRIDGKIGTLFVKNSITFVIYQKNLSQGVCTLGYVDGVRIKDLANYQGTLPAYYQVTDFEDFIIWASGTDIMAYGGGDLKVNARLFKLGTCGVGGLANPFGVPITASSNKLEKFSGYTLASNWKSLLFDVTGEDRKSRIDKVKFNFDKLASGARVNIVLKNNQGTSIFSDHISFTTDGAVTTRDFYPKIDTENFRIEADYVSGSAVNTVAIRNIKTNGTYII